MDREDIDFELRAVDEQILDELEQGWRTRQWLAAELGKSGEYIYQRIDLFIKLGVVERIHDGFYRLADGGDAPQDPIEAVASTIAIGRTKQAEDANRELVRVATRWLQGQDGVIKKGDAPLDEWRAVDTHPDAPRTDESLWNDTVLVAWGRSEQVRQPHSRGHEWVGED
jgi:DNA-binding Lrp family transcriptional regulator